MTNKKKINKSVFLFFLLSFTWALPTTILGALVSLALIATGRRPKKFGPCWRIPTKNNYGLELGLFFVASDNSPYTLKCHEVGHHLQACFLFGPLTLFFAFIPSVVRFWLREQKTQKKKKIYSSIVSFIPMVIFSCFVVLGIAFSIWSLVVVFSILVIYMAFMAYWLFRVEIPKYEREPYPLYDDFIIEYDASKRGRLFIDKNYPEEKRKHFL